MFSALDYPWYIRWMKNPLQREGQAHRREKALNFRWLSPTGGTALDACLGRSQHQ